MKTRLILIVGMFGLASCTQVQTVPEYWIDTTSKEPAVALWCQKDVQGEWKVHKRFGSAEELETIIDEIASSWFINVYMAKADQRLEMFFRDRGKKIIPFYIDPNTLEFVFERGRSARLGRLLRDKEASAPYKPRLLSPGGPDIPPWKSAPHIFAGFNNFHDAVAYGTLEDVESYLKQSANVSRQNELCQNALHMAAASGNPVKVQLILAENPDIDVRDTFGMTALNWSSKLGFIGCANELLNSRANPYLINENGRNAFHNAAANGHADVVKLFVPLIDIDIGDINGLSSLHLAAKNCRSDVVAVLLEAGADVNALNRAHETALHITARDGCMEITELLLKHGAVIDLQTRSKMTALHYASMVGNLDIVKLLRENEADINIMNVSGETPLHFAVMLGHEDTALFLLDGTTNINAKNDRKETLLHYACRHNLISVAERILIKGADRCAKDKNGKTPYDWAIVEGHPEIAELVRIKPVDEPINIDLSAVQWVGQGSFEDLTRDEIAQIIITDDMPTFQECEKYVIMPGTSYRSEFRECLKAISELRETNDQLPVGGGKIWFVFPNRTGMFLEANDNDENKATLVRDNSGAVRQSEEFWRLTQELWERVGLKTD